MIIKIKIDIGSKPDAIADAIDDKWVSLLLRLDK